MDLISEVDSKGLAVMFRSENQYFVQLFLNAQPLAEFQEIVSIPQKYATDFMTSGNNGR